MVTLRSSDGDGVGALVAESLTFAYPPLKAPVTVLQHLSLHVRTGEVVSLVGPSGCGKSTLLSILGGLQPPDAGQVFLQGRDITARAGEVGYLMQSDQLLPWLTTLDNVMLGAQVRGRGSRRSDTEQRARQLLARFGLAGFADHYPHALSGGMRQRVAFLRSLLCDWKVLLLDEPFRGIDALTKSQLHEWLLQLRSDFGLTILLVTHDPEEAVFLSDRVYVLSQRPMSVIDEIKIDLDRTRDVSLLGEIEFAQLKRRVLTTLLTNAPSDAGAAR